MGKYVRKRLTEIVLIDIFNLTNKKKYIWLGDHNMGKNKQNKISVPITRYGKDICRVIFQRNADGKYDIKFEFMGNSYQVNSYRLFSYGK